MCIVDNRLPGGMVSHVVTALGPLNDHATLTKGSSIPVSDHSHFHCHGVTNIAQLIPCGCAHGSTIASRRMSWYRQTAQTEASFAGGAGIGERQINLVRTDIVFGRTGGILILTGTSDQTLGENLRLIDIKCFLFNYGVGKPCPISSTQYVVAVVCWA